MPSYKRVARLPSGEVDPSCEVVQALAEAVRVAHDPTQVPDVEQAVIGLLEPLFRAGWWELGAHLAWPDQFAEFAPFHIEAFAWWSAIPDGESPDPFAGCWFRDGGKALALDEKLPTPDGWTTMRDVQVGDFVLDHAGRPTRVTAKTPVHRRPGRRVLFDDGAEVVCSDNHRWTVLTRNSLVQMRRDGYEIGADWPSWRPRSKPRGHGGRRSGGWTMTTDEMVEHAYTGRVGQKERLLAIPLGGVEGAHDDTLPIDPYWLGYWLGDGTSANSNITVGSEDLDEVQGLLECAEGATSRVQIRSTGAWKLRFTDPGRELASPLQSRLRQLGVLDDKHIPLAYLRAGASQRRALLAGLLDSDGTVAKNGRIEFTVVNERLALGFVALADSLATPTKITKGAAKLNGVDVGVRYRVTIRPDFNPFRLQRKRDRWRAPERKPIRRVDSVEDIGSIECACITVDSPDSLYLAGERLVPTHNSTVTGIALAIAIALKVRPYMLWVSDVLEQVVDKVTTVGALLQSPRMKAAFPEAAEQWTDPATGNKVDWRQGRIRTASGVTLDAAGMDQALRGRLVLLDRPGVIVLDDVESGTDTKYMRGKKRKQLTETIIPMGSDDVAIAFVQNRIHKDSLMSQVIDGRADFLTSRVLSGPWPQVKNMETEVEDLGGGRSQVVVVGGEFVWPAARGLAVTERQIRNMGLGAFRSEHQHEGTATKGHYFRPELWRRSVEGPSGRVKVCRGWDFGGTEGGGDFTVGVLLGVEPDGRVWILDVRRAQVDSAGLDTLMKKTAESDRETWGRRFRMVVIEQEPGSAGKRDAERMKRKLLAPSPVTIVPHQVDKETRARGLSAVQLSGNAWLWVTGEWDVEEFVEEYELFPFGENDDQVDGGTTAYNFFGGTAVVTSRGSLASAANRQIV